MPKGSRMVRAYAEQSTCTGQTLQIALARISRRSRSSFRSNVEGGKNKCAWLPRHSALSCQSSGDKGSSFLASRQAPEPNPAYQHSPGKSWKGIRLVFATCDRLQVSVTTGSTSRTMPSTSAILTVSPRPMPDSRCAAARHRAPATSTSPSGLKSTRAVPWLPTR